MALPRNSKKTGVDRRRFLGTIGAGAAVVASGASLTGCGGADAAGGVPQLGLAGHRDQPHHHGYIDHHLQRQDWALCENAQAGMRSTAWKPGPYSELESQLAAFDRHYLRVLHQP